MDEIKILHYYSPPKSDKIYVVHFYQDYESYYIVDVYWGKREKELKSQNKCKTKLKINAEEYNRQIISEKLKKGYVDISSSDYNGPMTTGEYFDIRDRIITGEKNWIGKCVKDCSMGFDLGIEYFCRNSVINGYIEAEDKFGSWVKIDSGCFERMK